MGNKNYLIDVNGENLCVYYDIKINGFERSKEF